MPYYNEKNKIASMKYIKDKQRSISLLFSKEQYEKIIEPAIKKTGLPVATFIKQAIMEKIERDNLIEEVSDVRNMALNNNTCMSLDNKDIDPDSRKDSNTTKDFTISLPLQFNNSFIVTDHEGSILSKLSEPLLENGYHIKILNLYDTKHSCMYNPFHYLQNDKDVSELVDEIIISTEVNSPINKNSIFDIAEKSLLQAITYYVYLEYKDIPEKQNISEIITLLNEALNSESANTLDSSLDVIFCKLEKKNKNHIAVIKYNEFKMFSAKSSNAIIMNLSARLAMFNIPVVKNLMQKDTLHLGEFENGKQALFIITQKDDCISNFIVSMIYKQMLSISRTNHFTHNLALAWQPLGNSTSDVKPPTT